MRTYGNYHECLQYYFDVHIRTDIHQRIYPLAELLAC